MVFSRQEYWSGLPFPSPGYLPNPGVDPASPALKADSLPSEPLGKALLLLDYCEFLPLLMLIFAVCIQGILCWGHTYLQLLYIFVGLFP